MVCLANLRPDTEEQELDSQMYQTVGWEAVSVMITDF